VPPPPPAACTSCWTTGRVALADDADGHAVTLQALRPWRFFLGFRAGTDGRDAVLADVLDDDALRAPSADVDLARGCYCFRCAGGDVTFALVGPATADDGTDETVRVVAASAAVTGSVRVVCSSTRRAPALAPLRAAGGARSVAHAAVAVRGHGSAPPACGPSGPRAALEVHSLLACGAGLTLRVEQTPRGACPTRPHRCEQNLHTFCWHLLKFNACFASQEEAAAPAA